MTPEAERSSMPYMLNKQLTDIRQAGDASDSEAFGWCIVYWYGDKKDILYTKNEIYETTLKLYELRTLDADFSGQTSPEY